MRLAVAMPSHETIYAETAMCLTHLCVHVAAQKIEFITINPNMARVEVARNKAVEIAKQHMCQYILFLDADMTFPKEAFNQLLSHKKDIIACNALKRVAPYKPVMEKDLFGKKLDYKKGGIRKMDLIGTAVMLINMDVFAKLKKPYFFAQYTVDGDSWRGEDYTFCKRSREVGYDIWCDLDLSQRIGHIGPRAWHLRDNVEFLND